MSDTGGVRLTGSATTPDATGFFCIRADVEDAETPGTHEESWPTRPAGRVDSAAARRSILGAVVPVGRGCEEKLPYVGIRVIKRLILARNLS